MSANRTLWPRFGTVGDEPGIGFTSHGDPDKLFRAVTGESGLLLIHGLLARAKERGRLSLRLRIVRVGRGCLGVFGRVRI